MSMTEKEKMLAGLNYDAGDPELSKAREIAKRITRELSTVDRESDEYMLLLKELIGEFPEDAWIEAPFYCDYGDNISLGKKFYGNMNIVMLDCARITIGDNVLIGPFCGLYTALHPIEPEGRLAGLESAKPITIGNNVWLGGHVVVNPGVTIGDNSVIGSGSVVTKDIPANVVAAGNPCRVIKNIE